MELLLAVARSLQQRRQPLRSPQALAILNHAHADGRRSRRSGQVPASQIARRHCLVTAGTRQPRVGASRTAVLPRSPSARRAAANPIARRDPPPAEIPCTFRVTLLPNEAPATPGPLRSVTSTRTTPSPALTATVTVSPCFARAAVPHAVAEQLTSTRTATSRTGARGRAPRHERTGDPRPLGRPATVMLSRTAAVSAPAFPAARVPEITGPRRAHRDARPTHRRTSSRNKPPTRPVRGRPWNSRRCHRPSCGTAPSAIRPWTPRHNGPQRDKVTHDGTEKNGPHSREFRS